MKKYKKLLIVILLVILLVTLFLLFFKNEIFTFVKVKQYEQKYKNINIVEKNLSFDKNTNQLEENNTDINGFKISLSDFNYNQNDKKLDFNLKFENENKLNTVGYILRVYNEEYCLGDRFNGPVSIDTSIDYIINHSKFYEDKFEYKSKTIDMTNAEIIENDLLNECQMIKQEELLEDGSLVHKISFELPEQFIITDNLKVELFDLNYQNIGDSMIYQAKEPLAQIEYTINLSEN